LQRIVTKKLTSPGQHYAFTTLDEAPLKDSYTRHTTKLVLRLCVTEVEKNAKREKIQVVTELMLVKMILLPKKVRLFFLSFFRSVSVSVRDQSTVNLSTNSWFLQDRLRWR